MLKTDNDGELKVEEKAAEGQEKESVEKKA